MIVKYINDKLTTDKTSCYYKTAFNRNWDAIMRMNSYLTKKTAFNKDWEAIKCMKEFVNQMSQFPKMELFSKIS